MHKEDLTSRRFGRLEVIRVDPVRIHKSVAWVCRCDCGAIKSLTGSHLRQGLVSSCGCLRREHAAQMKSPPPPRLDVTGQVFGRLTAISATHTPRRPARWLCSCACGGETTVVLSKLTSGLTVSCGCYRAEMSRARVLERRYIGWKRADQHPKWKPELSAWDRRHEREPENQLWRREIVRRDGNKCVACGSTEDIHAHHLRSYTLHPEIRYEMSNGVTVCGGCHRSYHSHVGRIDFTAESFFEFFKLAQAA